MRKIEQQMNDAVANNKNWQSANTSVHYNEENGVSIVRLHGNKIAEIGDDYLQIFDGGWQTTTTKSRLNALIDRFCNAVTDGVFQKDYQWFIRDNNVTRDFDNGYIFAWDDYTERLTLSPYSLHTFPMKTVLIIIIGVLLWQSTDARKFTANVLQTASDIIEPDVNENKTIGERIDSFLNWNLGSTVLA